MNRKHLSTALSTALLLALGACEESSTSPADPAPQAKDTPATDTSKHASAPRIAVLGQKYGQASSSSLQAILGGAIVDATPSGGMPSHSNTRIDVTGGALVLFDGNLGTATAFPGGATSSAPIFDENLGSGSNPYSASRMGSRVWFALYGSAKLVGLSLSGAARREIDLSAFNASGASNPSATSVSAWNGKLVVVLQRQDANWTAADSGLVLLVDTADGSIDARIAIPFSNPYDVDQRGDLLALGCTGGWKSSTDGGLAVVDLSKGRVVQAVASTELGGDPSSVAIVSESKAWAGLDLGWPNTKARLIDISTGKPGIRFEAATAVSDLAFDGTSLWIANHDDAAPYVYAIDPASGEQKSRLTATLAPGFLKVVP